MTAPASSGDELDTLIDHLITRETHKGAVNRVRSQLKEAVAQALAAADRSARIDLLIKIANNEGWEESAYIYCTDKEIGLSPNEFEQLRTDAGGGKV